ncbi:hypothetical protein T439DRAFT_329793 [Meredithblackwellia eburnea MCA 4105]
MSTTAGPFTPNAQRPLAPSNASTTTTATTSQGASHLWNNHQQQPQSGTTTPAAGGGGGGLQLPTKPQQISNNNTSTSNVGTPSAGTPTAQIPAQSSVKPQQLQQKQQSPGPAGESTNESKSTDINDLLDPTAASGVDISAEDAALRAANERLHPPPPPLAPGQDRNRRQTFIDPQVLAEAVKKIAAGFALRTLEPDTIPFIALATRHRLMALIQDAIAARDHRQGSSHFRPPPLTTKKRKRGDNGSEGEEEDDEEEDEDEEDDDDFDDDEAEFEFDFDGGELKRKKKAKVGGASGKGKTKENGGPRLKAPKEPEPAWDVVVFDEPEKSLGVLERVDREEERKKRRERMLRDQKEEEERLMQEAIKAAEEAERELNGTAGTASGAGGAGPNGDSLLFGSTPGASGSGGAGTPGVGAGGEDGDETPKEKKKAAPKKKKESATAAARNMTEDVKKRLTDQVAMRQLGGRSFSWLNSSTGGAALSSSLGGGLPKPKFAPGASSLSTGGVTASSLPAPNFSASTPTVPGAGGSGTTDVTMGDASAAGPSSALPPGLSRLNNVPPMHDANRNRQAREAWEKSQHVVEVGDLLFAMERERGMGVGKGTGRDTLLRARAGVQKPRPPAPVPPHLQQQQQQQQTQQGR